MTPWDSMEREPILTGNFTKLLTAFYQAIARKEIIGVISPGGVGFKYTLKHFVAKHYLKVVYCNVRQSESIREVILELYKHLCNVKFSNIDYRKTTLFDLVRVLKYRLSLDDGCLLCIDNCDNLKPGQLKYFTQFLNDLDRPMGLVFRMNERYAIEIAKNRKFQSSFERLSKVVDNWRVLERCSDTEIRDIAGRYVSDITLVNDLVKATNGNLSVLEKHLVRISKHNNVQL